MKKKLTLTKLAVQSFVTQVDNQPAIKGGLPPVNTVPVASCVFYCPTHAPFYCIQE